MRTIPSSSGVRRKRQIRGTRATTGNRRGIVGVRNKSEKFGARETDYVRFMSVPPAVKHAPPGVRRVVLAFGEPLGNCAGDGTDIPRPTLRLNNDG